MTQGETPKTRGMFNLSRDYCDRTLSDTSIYRLLSDIGDQLFPSEFFADLYMKTGRNSVPPRILATVMVLQRLGGLSDREAADRFMYDARWKYACGGLDADYPEFGSTVLVYMRARLRGSDTPTRIFDAVLSLARDSGLVGVRRVLDSTPLYDAVATQDTVTLVRSAIRGVLKTCDKATKRQVYAVLKRDDPYVSPGKPSCAWDDADARMALVDALARDGYAVLTYFEENSAAPKTAEKLRDSLVLLATVLGQDLELVVEAEGDDEIDKAKAKPKRAKQPKSKKRRRRGRPRKRRKSKSGDTDEADADTGEADADTGEADADTSEADADTSEADADTSEADADTGEADADTTDADNVEVAAKPSEGTYRIARRVAKDRIISTVDPETRHGHKTKSRHFDGYKGHIAIDPDSEIITATAVTAGNAADGAPVAALISDMIAGVEIKPKSSSDGPQQSVDSGFVQSTSVQPLAAATSGRGRRLLMTTVGFLAAILDSAVSAALGVTTIYADSTAFEPVVEAASSGDANAVAFGRKGIPALYGDCAYGTATILSLLDGFGVKAMTRVQLPASRGGRFSQAHFQIDLPAATVTCPADQTVNLRPQKDGTRAAGFGVRCRGCPVREQCTSSKTGRTVTVHAQHDVLEAHRAKQEDPDWQQDYKATRPKVERKIGHMMRRKHGGRQARVRGRLRVDLDFSMLAAATNLARLAKLGLNSNNGRWAVAAN